MNMKLRFNVILIVAGIIVIGVAFLWATRLSNNFRMRADTVNYGGKVVQSANCQIFDAVGQGWHTGEIESGNHRGYSGYVYQARLARSFATPTPTPVIAPTWTPAPLNQPVIMLGGYWNLPTVDGGPLTILAYVYDENGVGSIDNVGVYHQGNPMGLDLVDDGMNGDFSVGDGIFGFTFDMDPLPGPIRDVFEIVAFDADGNQSFTWPYLTVTSGKGERIKGKDVDGELPFDKEGAIFLSVIDAIEENSLTQRDYKKRSTYRSKNTFIPEIKLAGYWDTAITELAGGQLTMVALVSHPRGIASVDSVEICFEGVSTGLLLRDDGRHADGSPMDGLYGYTITIPPGMAAGQYLLQLVATDRMGNQSRMWPYLDINR